MKVFVINLDRDIERMKFINEQALKNDIEVVRVSGIYGRDLSKKDVKSSVNRFRWLCATGRSPLIGEIGCALSHLKVYDKMVKENIPFACILEDDIFFLEGFNDKLRQIEKWADPNRPIVVRLNYSGDGRDEDTRKTETGVVKANGGTAACSYVLTLSAAKALLNENYPLVTPSDHWFRWVRYGIIELYNCDTKVCWHNNAASGFSSTITATHTSIHTSIQRVSYKLMRIIGKPIDRLYMRARHRL